MASFSAKQRLQRLAPLVYANDLQIIDQVIRGLIPLSLYFHNVLESSVAFEHRDKANATELSKTLWKYKDKGIKPRITWSIICKSFAYTSGAKRCNLCLAEKLAILQADQRTLLNKRSEFVSKCRHWNKFKLKKA